MEERGRYGVAPRPCQRTPCDARLPASTAKWPRQSHTHTPRSVRARPRGGSLIAPQPTGGYHCLSRSIVFLPRDLGRRFMFQQGDSSAPGRGARGDRRTSTTSDTAQSDIDAVIRTLGRVSSPSILVGHSYGGAVITGAGIDDRVVGLVYVCAVAPDEDETAASQQAKYPTTELFGQIEVADGRIWMLPSGIGYFCGDLPAGAATRPAGDHDAPRRGDCSTRSPRAPRGRPEAKRLHRGQQRPAPFARSGARLGRAQWAPRPTRSTAATCRCCPSLM